MAYEYASLHVSGAEHGFQRHSVLHGGPYREMYEDGTQPK